MSEERFRLHGFVCDGGCVRQQEQMGWMTWKQIVSRQLMGCRYAVVERHDGQIAVWDMLSDSVLFGHHPPPWPEHGVYKTVDAAFMATAMRYEP